MRIAIIGAGFAGLSLAWHLLQIKNDLKIMIYDGRGVGGGASGVAPGLCHPYPGEQGRRSLFANEALFSTQSLVSIMERRSQKKICLSKGIVRIAQNDQQRENFLCHAKEFQDVIAQDSDRFFLTSGMTIDCRSYLNELWKAIEERGGEFFIQRIETIEELRDFDEIVVAAGAGIEQLIECSSLKIRFSRGQVLTCASVYPFENSLIAKGYLAISREKGIYHLGSTYEKGNHSDQPNLESAKNELIPKSSAFFPSIDKIKILECKAAVRVLRIGHYAPLIGQLRKGLWVFTGLGSRGLLYHAFLAEKLALALLFKNPAYIPEPFRIEVL